VELSLAQSISDSAPVRNSGPTKTRAETWLDYQENADGRGSTKSPRRFTCRWRQRRRLAFHRTIDVPLLDTNKEGPANSAGDWQIHVGDILTELYATTPPVAPDLTWREPAAGVADRGPPPFGDGQYQWAPAPLPQLPRPDLGYA